MNPRQTFEIIIGKGQIGMSLDEVLRPTSPYLIIFDREASTAPWRPVQVDYLHICFGWSENFIHIVSKYVEKFKPMVTIIHSTVPVGTTRAVMMLSKHETIVHSPVRGQHPDLAPGLKTFTKYVSGTQPFVVGQALVRLRAAGIVALEMENGPESTEIAKLGCTFRYGLNIAAAQMMERLCKKYGLNYAETYTAWEETYNEGYEKLGKPNVRRPVLFPGVIGGHCVLPNLDLLATQDPDVLIDAILASNAKKKKRETGLI